MIQKEWDFNADFFFTAIVLIWAFIFVGFLRS